MGIAMKAKCIKIKSTDMGHCIMLMEQHTLVILYLTF